MINHNFIYFQMKMVKLFKCTHIKSLQIKILKCQINILKIYDFKLNFTI